MASYIPHDPEVETGSDDIIAEINITPLTDVFLVLLIIFMVTSSVMASQGKPVNLPEAVKSTATSSKSVTVTVTEAGEIQVNDQIVAEADLAAALKRAIDEAEEKVVLLRGDRRILLGQAVLILDLADQFGAKISIATKRSSAL